jgi:hypothetical protein
MTWVRNASFPLIPSGLEINFRRQSKDGRDTWISLKGEDAQVIEQLAETILRCLNPAGHLEADIKTHDLEGEVRPRVAEARLVS